MTQSPHWKTTLVAGAVVVFPNPCERTTKLLFSLARLPSAKLSSAATDTSSSAASRAAIMTAASRSRVAVCESHATRIGLSHCLETPA